MLIEASFNCLFPSVNNYCFAYTSFIVSPKICHILLFKIHFFMYNIDSFVLIRLISYLLYRIIRTLILIESDILALLHRIWDKKNARVEFFNVMARWVIYTISDKYVYFVQIPHTEKLSIDENCKMTEYLFKFADKVARMDVDIFINEFKGFPPFKSKFKKIIFSFVKIGRLFWGDILISDTATAIRPILNICEISDLAIPDCIEWKRKEVCELWSMWNTTPLTETYRARAKTLVDYLQQYCSY
uniref:Ras-GEF domain-containing protein n=1 Tax=Heterorhabditis bacteriophora TaxID=37862 RepID=A0A1I7WI51_HETBA